MEEHRHAIIIIKNSQGEYLQYYDSRWNSFLFLNLKMNKDFDENDIKENVYKKLGISVNSITTKFLMDKKHKKFSESAKIEKEYHHYFYLVNIDIIPDFMKEGDFILNDIQYKWFTMEQLENDERIQKVNSDIVNYIKSLKLDI